MKDKQFIRGQLYKFINPDPASSVGFWRSPNLHNVQLKTDAVEIKDLMWVYCVETNIKPTNHQYVMVKLLTEYGIVYTREDNIDNFKAISKKL